MDKSRASLARRTGSIPVRIAVCVAQLVERRVVVPEAAGSSPVMHLDFLLYVFYFSSALTLKNSPKITIKNVCSVFVDRTYNIEYNMLEAR